MGLREDLKTVLTDGVPVVSGRVYPLIMPIDTKKNSIVYTIIGDVENTGLGGTKCYSNMAIQVDVYAVTYAEALQNKVSAIAALREAFNVADLSTYELYEDITVKYRQVIDFRLLSYQE